MVASHEMRYQEYIDYWLPVTCAVLLYLFCFWGSKDFCEGSDVLEVDITRDKKGTDRLAHVSYRRTNKRYLNEIVSTPRGIPCSKPCPRQLDTGQNGRMS